MNDLTITKHNGGAYIDSREVAAFVGKRHDNLIRDIVGYVKTLRKTTHLNFEVSEFFLESTYFDRTGRELLRFLCSRKGCELIAHKLTGEKGVMFTAAYIQKFHTMESAEREREIKAYGRPRLSEFNAAVKNILSGMSKVYTAPDDVMKFLRGVYEPLGIAVAEDNYSPCYYSATDIAQVNGIYSVSGRPHSHAVAAIISMLNIHESQMVAVPYGLVGVTYRYDIDVMCAVGDWIAENGFPQKIPYLYFDYHIYYKRDNSGIIKDGFFISLNDVEPDGYTAAELDAMCGNFGDCDECPGFPYCCEVD